MPCALSAMHYERLLVSPAITSAPTLHHTEPEIGEEREVVPTVYPYLACNNLLLSATDHETRTTLSPT